MSIFRHLGETQAAGVVGTDQQEALWSELATGNREVLVEARAGTGKSFSCREGMRRIARARPGQAIRYAVFGKANADEFKADCPRGVEAGTCHSFGLKALQNAFQPVIEKNKSYFLLDETEQGKRLPRWLRRAVSMLVGHAKGAALPVDAEYADLEALMLHYDISAYNREGDLIGWARKLLARSAERTDLVDFDDMLWLPLVHDVPFPDIDVLFIDECLPGWTPVMLADGGSMTIQEIVESKEEVVVRSYDTATGESKNCRVTAKQKLLNQKPLVKIKVKLDRRPGMRGRNENFVICTTDHKIWTRRGWIEAGSVRVGDGVIVETAAKKTQKGKIGGNGRRKLAELKIGNQLGKGGKGGNPHRFNQIKGGNGRGPSLAEQTLADALGHGWAAQLIVKTGDSPRHGRGDKPAAYKIDIANEAAKIAVEVDGFSHRAVATQEADQKKQAFLESRGWKVVRIPNRDAIQRTSSVVAHLVSEANQRRLICEGTNCPHSAKVVSIEAVEIRDNFVYDITVESCHNFYANGILVHNCQDWSHVQHRLIPLLAGAGRIVAVGDRFQAIYAFRGADPQSIPRLEKQLSQSDNGFVQFPLTQTFRCPKSHIELAKALVPDIEARPTAIEGVVDRGVSFDSLPGRVVPGDLVICPTNAPVVKAALACLAECKPAKVRGRALGDQLLSIVRQVGECDTLAKMSAGVQRWLAKELSRLSDREGVEDVIESLVDRAAGLQAVMESCDEPGQVSFAVDRLFSDVDDSRAVMFSTVHRAKGSEARTVYFIDLLPRKPKQDWEAEQQRNLRYVALTRSKERLVFVDPPEGGRKQGEV